MSSSLARTPLAARITIDPSFSDGYESNHSGELVGHSLEEAEFGSVIDVTSRTPSNIRFAETELNQLVDCPLASMQNCNSDLQLRHAMVAMQNMVE